MTIWRVRIACWIPKATNTHSQYVILIAFPLKQWVTEPVSVRLYFTYIAYLLFISVDDEMFLRPSIMCCMAAELHQQVGRCADFQGNVLSLSFMFSEVRCYVHRSSDFVCTVLNTFSRIRISAYITSSLSLADNVVSLPVMIYLQSTLRQRGLFAKLGLAGYAVDIVYVNCSLSVGNDIESDFTRFGTCVESPLC
jgi:hypothetical protein